MYQGYDVDVQRFADADANGDPVDPLSPRQDQPGLTNFHIFGGPHTGGCQFVFCDGSVRTISYSIGFEIHRRLASRKDGLPIDDAALR